MIDTVQRENLMRRMGFVVVLVAVGVLTTITMAQPAPQTARQALLETFFGTLGSLEKHLPQAMLAALH